ncbi:MAG: HD domain-containing protein, partial [Candidatus Aminicenantes bacterium]|nr:HD domain-containing protein [Candidatus Aminicenantes bacterium]
MEIEALIREVREYCPQCDADFLRRACHQAEKAFEELNTEPGRSCFRHSLQTAGVLAELHLDPVTVVAALLQGIQTYGGVPLEKIAESFGKEAAGLIEGISKLDKISWESLEKEKAEGLRKVFLAMADDLRVVLIKLGGQ